MSNHEKQVVSSIAKAMEQLPKEKREYLMGLADGIAMMSGRNEKKEEEPQTGKSA